MMKFIFCKLSCFLPACGAVAICVITSCASQGGANSGREKFDKRDANGNGKLTPEEVAEYSHRQLLSRYDLNNDSYISPDEWKAAYPSKEESDAHFNRIDKNADGKIASSEAVLYVTEHIHYSNHFKDLDENDDNNLHFKEFAESEPSFWNITVFSLKFR